MTKQTLAIASAACLLTSCATFFNNPSTRVNVYTSVPAQVTYRSRTFTTRNNAVQIKLPRSGSPAILTVKTDTVEKAIAVHPVNSFAYYTNIYFNYGIGMLIEAKKPLRYGYPRNVYIDMADTLPAYRKYRPKQNRYQPAYSRGELYITFEVPYTNIFLLKPKDEPVKTGVSFFGAGIGLDYYHHNNQFIHASATAVSNFPIPFPAPIEKRGTYESMRSAYFILSNNHHIRRFTLGYGFTYTFNTWSYMNTSSSGSTQTPVPNRESVSKTRNAWGLLASSYFHITPSFSAGITYRPTLIRPSADPSFEYEHLISIGCSWNVKLTGPRTKPVIRTH